MDLWGTLPRLLDLYKNLLASEKARIHLYPDQGYRRFSLHRPANFWDMRLQQALTKQPS